jgi:hypothetical protein
MLIVGRAEVTARPLTGQTVAVGTAVTLIAPDAAPYFLYAPHGLSDADAGDLAGYLVTVPDRSANSHDPVREFAFVTYADERRGGRGREEASAGDPIWLGDGWGAGAAMPEPIARLRRRVEAVAASVDFAPLLGSQPRLDFTSVYVDRYLPGGGFYPHADGAESYGPVIAGVSVGPGTATFGLWSDEDAAGPAAAEFSLEPNSLYFLSGPIRYTPWQHAIYDVKALRYGITFRTNP